MPNLATRRYGVARGMPDACAASFGRRRCAASSRRRRRERRRADAWPDPRSNDTPRTAPYRTWRRRSAGRCATGAGCRANRTRRGRGEMCGKGAVERERAAGCLRLLGEYGVDERGARAAAAASAPRRSADSRDRCGSRYFPESANSREVAAKYSNADPNAAATHAARRYRVLTRDKYISKPAPASIRLVRFAIQNPRAPVAHAGSVPVTSKPSA